MLIVMDSHATPENCAAVERAVRSLGFKPVAVPGPSRVAICVTGNDGTVRAPELAHLPGVAEVIRVTKPYKLVSREVRPDDTIVTVGDVAIGGRDPVIVAGPCSVETESRTLEIARRVKAAGARLFRAGAFKPRTSPYSFQGLGEEGLHTLRSVREECGLPVISEVIDPDGVDLMVDYVDILQVGARNMQNYSLLRRLGEVRHPVLLKRGLASSLEEWLMAAEYLLAAGNEQVILCERGIRTHSGHARNTLDLNVVPHVRTISHLPILVDPSHGVGDRARVRPMARAALACGAHGLLVEAHTDPDSAYSDAGQTISVETVAALARDAAVIGRLEEVGGERALEAAS